MRNEGGKTEIGWKRAGREGGREGGHIYLEDVPDRARQQDGAPVHQGIVRGLVSEKLDRGTTLGVHLLDTHTAFACLKAGGREGGREEGRERVRERNST